MRVLGFNWSRLAPALALLALLPFGAEGQLRTVVSNEVASSPREASLRLDFRDGGELFIAFQGNQVSVDGDVVGSYAKNGPLETAWRSLLSDAITLDDGPLAQALMDWAPPEGLSGEAAHVATLLDQALEEALALPEEAVDPATQDELTLSIPGEGSIIGALLSRSGVLKGLAEAVAGISLENASIHIGDDVTVEAGEEIEGTLILVEGDLQVEGTIHGDVVLAGGTVRLLDEGRITGDLRISDGKLEQSGGSVEGQLLDLDSGEEIHLNEVELAELRRDMEDEIRRDIRVSMREERDHRSNVLVGFVGNVGRAIAGLLENLITFIVLAVLGVLAVHFQRDRLEIISTTARKAPARSAMVGLAGGFLFFPLWLLGILVLAVSIIGIPVLLAWIPFFPIAAGLAGLLGFLAVARNVGEWVAEQEYRGLEWIRGSNTFYTVVAGVGALMLPCVASSAARVIGLGIFTGLLSFIGSMVTLAAVAVGLGAVLLTRGGKIRPFESYYEFEEEYWEGMNGGSPTEPDWDTTPPEPPEETPTPEADEPLAEETETEPDGDDESSDGGPESKGNEDHHA